MEPLIPSIALLFASLHVLLFVVLSLRVILWRKRMRVGLGSGKDEVLSRRVRVHANFAEYMPLALLLLALLELVGTRPVWLWSCGALLLAGRVLHAWGLGRSAGVSAGRFIGTLLTLIVLLWMAGLGVGRFAAGL